MNLKINSIQHVGIPAIDLLESEKFYQRLGFTNVMKANFDHADGKGEVIMMKMGSIILELYQLPEPALNEIKHRSDGKIDHIAFDVDDIDVTFKQITEAGFRTIEDKPLSLNFWKNGFRYFYILGPSGERLEFGQIL